MGSDGFQEVAMTLSKFQKQHLERIAWNPTLTTIDRFSASHNRSRHYLFAMKLKGFLNIDLFLFYLF
jgi:hypothetical protein